MKIILIIIICIIILLCTITLLLFKFRFIGSWEKFKSQIFKKEEKNMLISNLERKQSIKEIITTLIPLIEKEGIDIFAQFGTLLGLVREEDIICYDYDSDFCIFSKDWHKLKKVLRNFIKENTEFDWFFVDFPFISNIQLQNKLTGAYMDIGVRNIHNGKTYRKVPVKEKEIPISSFFPLKRIKLKDTNVYIKVPYDSDIFLRNWYGSNYMIPDKKCDKDCENCSTK